MTYYKTLHKTNIENLNNDNLNYQEKIDNIAHAIVQSIQGFLIITNLTTAKPNNFYSLKADKSEIHLIEKTTKNINSYTYNLQKHYLTLNNEQQNQQTILKFYKKLTKILTDLKTHKAYAYESK